MEFKKWNTRFSQLFFRPKRSISSVENFSIVEMTDF